MQFEWIPVEIVIGADRRAALRSTRPDSRNAELLSEFAEVLSAKFKAEFEEAGASGTPIQIDTTLAIHNTSVTLLAHPLSASGKHGRETWQGHIVVYRPKGIARSMFESLVLHSDDAILTKDMDNIITSWNPAAERLYGYTAQEVIGQNVGLIYPDDLQHELEQSMEGIADGSDFEFKNTIRRHKDGSEIFLQLTVSPICDEDGQIVGSSGIARKSETPGMANTSDRHLAAIVAASQDAMSNLMIDGTILAWNPAAERIYGYAAEEIVGKSILQIVPPEDHEDFLRHLPLIGRGSRIDNVETKRIRKDGTPIDVRVSFTPLSGANGEIDGIVAISRDITEQKIHQETITRIPGLDTLTGATNLPLFRDRLSKATSSANRVDRKTAVHHVCIPGFMSYHERYGEQFSNGILETLATRLRQTIRDSDTIGRIGHEEFAIIQTNVEALSGVDRMIEKLLGTVDTSFEIEGLNLPIELKIGTAVYPDHAADDADLLRHAREALLQAKDQNDVRARIHNRKNIALSRDYELTAATS